MRIACKVNPSDFCNPPDEHSRKLATLQTDICPFPRTTRANILAVQFVTVDPCPKPQLTSTKPLSTSNP
jgi:hypothetical protein